MPTFPRCLQLAEQQWEAQILITGADQVTAASNDHQSLHAATACSDAPLCLSVCTGSDITCSNTMRLTCHSQNNSKPGHCWQNLVQPHLKADIPLLVLYEWVQQEKCQMAVSLKLRLLEATIATA